MKENSVHPVLTSHEIVICQRSMLTLNRYCRATNYPEIYCGQYIDTNQPVKKTRKESSNGKYKLGKKMDGNKLKIHITNLNLDGVNLIKYKWK